MKTLATLLAIAAISAAAHAADYARTADHDYDAPAPGTYTLPIIKPAADGTLLDSTGKPVRLAELTRGRITVMSFIYTRCAAAKACPYATGVLMQLHRASAEDTSLAKRLCLVSMSFDPANDTPERMAAYSTLAAERPTAAPWHFVTTRSQAQLQPILSAYDQAVDKKNNPLDPSGPLNHTLRVFLIDPAGNIRNIYSSGTLDARLVLADVRTLMLESAQAGANPLTPRRCIPELSVCGSAAFRPLQGNEPTRLEFSESCGKSDSEAASTPRSDTDNLGMHGARVEPKIPSHHDSKTHSPFSKWVT